MTYLNTINTTVSDPIATVASAFGLRNINWGGCPPSSQPERLQSSRRRRPHPKIGGYTDTASAAGSNNSFCLRNISKGPGTASFELGKKTGQEQTAIDRAPAD
jgi:hypothetical protein